MSFKGDPSRGFVVHADLSVPRDPEQVPPIRRQVHRAAKLVLGDDRAYEASICASETLTNAVRHSKGDEIQILIYLKNDGLTVEVTDGGSGSAPYVRQDAIKAIEAESGRGLLLVSELADRWHHTTDPNTGRLSVSFDFDARPDTPMLQGSQHE